METLLHPSPDPAATLTPQARFHATLDYAPVDRGVWAQPWFGFAETLERWREAGYEEKDWMRYPTDAWAWPQGLLQPFPAFERRVLEEDARHVLYRNAHGALVRELKVNPTSSMPQFVEFPVHTREDFRAYFRERFQPDLRQRLGPDWVEQVKNWRGPSGPVIFIFSDYGGFFGPLRQLLGVEPLCRMFLEDPAFVEEMMDAFADFIIAVMDQVLEHTTVDIFSFWEDMCFNKGPLIGPDLARRFMLPRYRRVVAFLRDKGVRWIGLDSDGRIDMMLPVWLDAGIDLIFPLEVAAGMDVVALRRRFGRQLRMYGGIDKRTLAQGPAAIDRELARVRPLIEEGGYIAALDHSVTPEVPFPHFQYFMERLEEILRAG